MLRKVIITVVSLVILVLLAGIINYIFLAPNNNIVQAFDDSALNLVIQGELIESANTIILDNEILMPIEIIRSYIDPKIWWDDKTRKVTITTKDRVIRMKTESLEAYVNNEPIRLSIPVVILNETIYVPVEFLAEFYNITITHNKYNNVIIVEFDSVVLQSAEPVKKGAEIRRGRSIKYPIVKKLKSGTESPDETVMKIFKEYDKWYKVMTGDGILGYVQKKQVSVKIPDINEVKDEIINKDLDWKPEKGKINLVWEMMYSGRPETEKRSHIEGLDIISPTWFQVKDDQGNLINRADAKFVEWAHNNGYKIWALLSNDFNNIEMTSRLLNDSDARDNIIKQLLAYAALYKLDGINIDFENIYKKDKDALTQFVRELTPFLKEQGLVVSIDVTIPDGSDTWSLCYDRKALGEVVDYVMLMTYDQHWAASPVAGSVAQITWVERNLKKVLALVPPDKLILGLPFYTRLWKEEKNENGGLKVSSKAISMETARRIINENDVEVTWDNESGQFYAEYVKDKDTFKIWLEDSNSINLKSSLVLKYGLAGAASWSKNFEEPAVWEVLNRNLKVYNSYEQWNAENVIDYVYR